MSGIHQRHSGLLDEHMENYNVEASALHRKLQSKTEALKIMRSEMEKFRTERDQFKLMAETLQLRYSTIKRTSDYNNFGFEGKSSVANLLNETREKNIKLATELETLKQRIHEIQGDMDLLRKRNNELQNLNVKPTTRGPGKNDPEWKKEKADFIMVMETLKKKNAQLVFDLKAVIDEKEEAVSERDAFKCKAHRLNHELLVALKANDSNLGIVDIDGLVLENKYLQEKLKNFESETELLQHSINKYKTMLDTKRKKGNIKLGSNNSENIMSHKQVKSLLESGLELPSRAETIADLKSLCLALVDNLNDKNLALSHQKRTNKILASRIGELEQRLQLISGQNGCANFSPSQILLTGYCSSSVDEQKSSNVTEDSGTMSSDESNKTSQVFDDGMDSLSSGESNKSIISSEYSHSEIRPSSSSGIYTTNNSNKLDSCEQSLEDDGETLKELPPELAEMLHKALQNLDIIEENDITCN